MRASPTTPHGWLLLRLRSRYERARDSESGVSTVEWVIITAALLILAGVVGGVIYTMVNNAASDLEMPDAPGGG